MTKFSYHADPDEDECRLASEASVDLEREMMALDEAEEDEAMWEAQRMAAEELDWKASQHSNGQGKSRTVAPVTLDFEEQDGVLGLRPGGDRFANGPGKRAELSSNQRLRSLQEELEAVQAQIRDLRRLEKTLNADIESERARSASSSRPATQVHGVARPSQHNGPVDYTKVGWDWSQRMKQTMKRVWGIESFRLCQEAVCNAVMDGRDVVCVMPTGGGKSLCYQLPALLDSDATTLVVSPLIALMTDQILNLAEHDVLAVMLNGSTSKADAASIMDALVYGPNGSKKGKGKGRETRPNGDEDDEPQREIKLCYVTPEKIAKSKTFISTLQKMYERGRLSRIVIDEAHCCSQMGHDYRPDYKKLSMLKTLFPDVQIVALTATCPPHVLQDLLKILRMGPTTDPSHANSRGTVYFTAPLYRPNLRYQVLPKASSAPTVIENMADWILRHHPGKQGIVYTLSQKDTSTVAEGLRTSSKGKIKTGIYHAGLADHEKEEIHVRWRNGEINTVCATIAFGMGIDAPSVRFVIHHCCSKSMDGYYQESGRAGRDGKDADCVLLWRVQDASRLSGMTLGEVDGLPRLYSMISYATDLDTCRKVAFHRYFTSSKVAAVNSFAADDASGLERCGACDNCTRPAGSIISNNLSKTTWKVLRVAQEVQNKGGRVTLAQLADLCRGTGGSSFNVTGERGKGQTKVALNVNQVAGGKLELSKDDVEMVLMRLTIAAYLEEAFVPTAYSTNCYLVPGHNAIRYTRLTQEQVDAGQAPELYITLPARTGRKGSAASVSKTKGSKVRGVGTKSKSSKGTREPSSEDEDDFRAALDAVEENVLEDDLEKDDEDGGWDHVAPSHVQVKRAAKSPVLDLKEMRGYAASAALRRAASLNGSIRSVPFKKARVEVVELD